MLLKVVVLLVFQCICCEDINIGALFENDENLEKAFNFAIEYVNKNAKDQEFTFTPVVQNNLTASDPYLVMKSACSLLEEGVVAIFGPRTFQNIAVVQSTCDVKEIPHIVTRWNIRSARDEIMINVHPHPPVLARAYYQIIAANGWKTVSVLYEDNESLMRIKHLIQDAQVNGISIQLLQLDEFHSGSYRSTIKKLKTTEQQYIVIDCQIDILFEVLSQLQQAGLMNENYYYLITNLDAHTENLTPFKYSDAEITGIRLINPDKKQVQKLADEFFGDDTNILEATAWKLRVESALVMDAITMFTQVYTDRQKSSSVRLVMENNSLSCSESNSWEHGFSIVNLLKSYQYEGLTGHIRFDNEGFRSNFELTVYQLLEGGITDIGTWNSTTGVNITKPEDLLAAQDPESLRNRHFTVQIALTEPYAMHKQETTLLTGNDMFEGYGIDLIAKLAEMEGFNFTFIVREDKSNGAYNNVTKRWTGMIGDLIDHVADLAICDFTITSDREEAVDFTVPFMQLGISILFKKPKNAPPSFFSFADPFGLDTWAAMGISFFLVSCAYFFIGRICADEWTNPYPCVEEPEYLVNQFSFQNSLWFATGALLAQGSEMAPIAFSTRMVSGIWWYFCLIMTASYTANLAAFLATENPIKLFTDLESLYENEHDIVFGAKAGGASLKYFTSAEPGTLLKKVGDNMAAHPENCPKENDHGVDKVEQSDYAFFMESSSIEYVTQRHCNLMKYGENLDSKGYGIAMRKGSLYRKRLSLALLQLQQNHYLDDLKKKWWEERRGGGGCEGVKENTEADPLGLVNVEGCFYCTIYGTALSAVLVIIEHLLYLLHVSKRSKIPFVKLFMTELKAYINFNSASKPNLMMENKSESGGSQKDEEEGENEEDKEETKSSISKTKTKSRSTRSRSSSVSRARLRYNKKRKSALSKKSLTVQPYGFIIPGSMESLKS